MNSASKKNWLRFGIVVAIAAGAIAFVVVEVTQVRRHLFLKQTHNDLKWIGIALHRYHDEHGHFPPAVLRNENGVPMHSWRSLIEPYLARTAVAADRFSGYDLNQAWNSFVNRDAGAQHRFGHHEYQFLAIVGPHAAWNSNGTRQISDFTDGTSETVLVIAIRDSGIAWHEPRDAEFNGTALFVGGQQVQPSQDLFVLLADGTVRHCASIPPETLASLITVDVGENVGE